MIAPLRETSSPTHAERLSGPVRRARRMVADVLFHPAHESRTPPPIGAVPAWLLVTWTVLVLAAYVARMTGWWM